MWGVIFPLKSVYFVKYSNIWSPLCQWIIFTKRKDFRMLKNTIKLLVILQIHYEICFPKAALHFGFHIKTSPREKRLEIIEGK